MRRVGQAVRGASFWLALIPAPVFAQTLTEAEAATLPRIIDHQCLELIEDINGCENVLLIKNSDVGADLIILPDYRNTDMTAPLLVARDFVWAGDIWGQWPSISQRDNGSLVITSEQFGIGRDAWTQDLTVAWRDGVFVVAGLTYSDVDRLLAFTSSCDVNLLNGRWETTVGTFADHANSGKIPPESVAAADWTYQFMLPEPCLEARAQLALDADACIAEPAQSGCNGDN